MPSKKDIRRDIRAILPDPPDVRAGKSARLCAAIATSPKWRDARAVAIFAPLPKEPDVEMLWEHAAGKLIAYPRVQEEHLVLQVVSSLYELLAGSWGVREPAPDAGRVLAPDAVDLIVVPGIAFTRDCARLGRGGGFYDRLLATLRPGACKIGVCFDFQVIPELPVEVHDQPVDFVVTESGVFAPR